MANKLDSSNGCVQKQQEKTQPRTRKPKKLIKYEMTKRKEKWNALNNPIEKLLAIPPERKSSVVKQLVSKTCYTHLAPMLDLSPSSLSCVQVESSTESLETIIPFVPAYDNSLAPESQSYRQQSKLSAESRQYESVTTSSYQFSSVASEEVDKQLVDFTLTKESSDEYEAKSDFVEVEKKTPHDHDQMLMHKAILRFLHRPIKEVATWRKRESKCDMELSEMSLEEQGGFLIDKIAADFCEWMRKLGGDEKTHISEDILKELFQIGMDNPASRALCIKEREKRVLYYSLAEFLQVPKKSFQEVLSLHLNWDSKVEKLHTDLTAFGRGLPKDLRFKAPKNKTKETWLEWKQMSAEEMSFADVYRTIKDLRSTKEYCRWLLNHPEHKRPQYLVDQGMFNRPPSIQIRTGSLRPSEEQLSYSNVSIAPSEPEPQGGKVGKVKFQESVTTIQPLARRV